MGKLILFCLFGISWTIPSESYADKYYTIYKPLNITAASNEQECWPINLEQMVPSAKWNYSDNQGLFPWCSALAGANAVTFETGHAVSGAFLAVRQELIKRGERVSAGQRLESFQAEKGGEDLGICETIHSVSAKGFCPLELIEGAGFAPNILLAQWKNNAKGAFVDFYSEIVRNKCLNEMKPAGPLSCGYFLRNSQTSMAGTIDRLLEGGFMPVLVFNEKAIYTDAVHCPDVAPHAVPVVGRRWNGPKNRCEYKIKNSIRHNICDVYNETVSCSSEEVLANEVWITSMVVEKTAYHVTKISSGRQRMLPVKPTGIMTNAD